jgi:cyclomaltodextrinase / maltogenic alpha-amylase / neopullulanase
MVFQMTYPGAPSIYYGDEIGMQGGHDPANRGAFPWHQRESWDTELLHEFQRLISLRQASPALRRGTFQILHAAGDLFAHARQLGEETLVVVFNTSRSNRRLDLRLHGLVRDGTMLEDVWTHRGQRVENGMLYRIELAPRSALILSTLHRT